jgi:hypothetical protein
MAFILAFGVSSAQALEETKPPHLDSLSISPTTVNVTKLFGLLKVTAHVLDRGPGVTAVTVTLFAPEERQGVAATMPLSTGTPTNGIYKGEIRIPEHAYPGAWKVHLRIFDAQGNVAEPTPAELEAKGFPGTINVE